MSIAKTLIQKEIDRQNRATKSSEDAIISYKKAIKKDESTKGVYGDLIKSHEKKLPPHRANLKELEADLKKL